MTASMKRSFEEAFSPVGAASADTDLTDLWHGAESTGSTNESE